MSHQDRREPLPKGYQFPTHGVDCDCPPCRNRLTIVGIALVDTDPHRHKFTYQIDLDAFVCRCGVSVSSSDLFVRPNALLPIEEPSAETPWGV